MGDGRGGGGKGGWGWLCVRFMCLVACGVFFFFLIPPGSKFYGLVLNRGVLGV